MGKKNKKKHPALDQLPHHPLHQKQHPRNKQQRMMPNSHITNNNSNTKQQPQKQQRHLRQQLQQQHRAQQGGILVCFVRTLIASSPPMLLWKLNTMHLANAALIISTHLVHCCFSQYPWASSITSRTWSSVIKYKDFSDALHCDILWRRRLHQRI